MDDDRTTQEVIEVLGEDCDRCHGELVAAIDAGEVDSDGSVSADYEYHARQLIRAIFAYIEAVTFSMKAWSAGHCMEHGIEITPQERYFATDTEYELDDRGEVVETTARIPLARNIRFAITLNRKAHGVSQRFDASVEWWSSLKKAIRVRDRLTHPKLPGDLDVSGDDIVDALKAKAGFEKEALRYGWPTTIILTGRRQLS
jgi:hypothetical protein